MTIPQRAQRSLLDGLCATDTLGNPTYVHQVPATTAMTGPWPTWADHRLIAGYRHHGVTSPWRHQVEAAQAAWDHRHVALATSTGSGKSLSFWLPVLTTIHQAAPQTEGRIDWVYPTALYLSPTKALAADQHTALTELHHAAGLDPHRISTCDGDTATSERSWIQHHAQVILTNPDFIHFSLLGAHRRWSRFLSGLRYVIIDEAHSYRGVFGAHIALVLRRLRRLAAYYQTHAAPPLTFLTASATCADPAQTTARLIGVNPEDVHAITQSTAPRSASTLALWSPLSTPDGRPRSAPAESSELLAQLVSAQAQTLVFTRSRQTTESVALSVREHLDAQQPPLGHLVAAYRGGYLPEERRALESALRNGSLQGLVTTNALELGIDIHGLDVVVITGWPGTRMSLWQQAGRAGRAGKPGLVIFIARQDPLDTYIIHHPEEILAAPLEPVVFNTSNPYVMAPHLAAAAQELPLRPEDIHLFGEESVVRAILDDLVVRGALRRRPHGWYWTHEFPAVSLTDLRGAGGEPIRIVEAETGRILGTVDPNSADTTVHRGAVYLHQGVSHVVDRYAPEDSVAVVHREDVSFRTVAHATLQVNLDSSSLPSRTSTTGTWGPIDWGYGPVEVITQAVSFQRRSTHHHQLLATVPLDLPERTLATMGVWWTVPAPVIGASQVPVRCVPGALHALEHAAIAILPLLATCDRGDLGGVSTAMHPHTGAATIVVYDAHPGGAGFSEQGLLQVRQWWQTTMTMMLDCPCTDGCPACVQSPKCGSDNQPLDKAGAIAIVRELLMSLR